MPLWQALIATVVGMGIVVIPLIYISTHPLPPKDRNRDAYWPEPRLTNCVIHPDYAMHANVSPPDGAKPLRVGPPPKPHTASEPN